MIWWYTFYLISLEESNEKDNIKSSDVSKEFQVIIESAQLEHEGIYTCVGTNKGGSLDVDVHLTVLGKISSFFQNINISGLFRLVKYFMFFFPLTDF